MNINKIFRRLPIRTKLTIGFAMTALLPLAVIGVYVIWITSVSLENNAVAQVRHYIELVKVDVANFLEHTQSDLDYLEHLDYFSAFVSQASSGEMVSHNALSEAIAQFCASHPVYFQIRYLNLDGDELLRVVDLGDGYAAWPPRLGDRSGARFYRHALEQAQPKILLSIPVELKHPSNPDELVPAISFVRLSEDDQGESRGMWVADLYAARLIELLSRSPVMPGGELVLCDTQG